MSQNVRKTDKPEPGVDRHDTTVTLEVAAARLYNAGNFDTVAEAAAALQTGRRIDTHYCTYQLTEAGDA